MPEPEKEQRLKIFRALLPYYGKLVTPEFLRKSSSFIPIVEIIHPLIEGIYKPAWSEHALSIASMKSNPCADKITHLSDGRCRIKYSPKKGIARSARTSPFSLSHGDAIIAIEVKSGRKKTSLPGIGAFSKEFKVKKKILVGSQGIPLEDFFYFSVEEWFK